MVYAAKGCMDKKDKVTKPSHGYEYHLAKATLKWLVSIKLLTPLEAKEVDRLNRISFNVPDDVSPNWYDA